MYLHIKRSPYVAMLMYLCVICEVLHLSNVNLPSLSWKLTHVLDESLMPIFTTPKHINTYFNMNTYDYWHREQELKAQHKNHAHTLTLVALFPQTPEMNETNTYIRVSFNWRFSYQ
jgi:hypothetical protein